MEMNKGSLQMRRPMRDPYSGKRFWRKLYVACPVCEKRICDVSAYEALVPYRIDDPSQPEWEPKLAIKCGNKDCGAEILLFSPHAPKENNS